jgi:hypothetical protein
MDYPSMVDTESVAGTWHLSEKEMGSFGKKYWIDAQGTSKDIRVILPDGSILDADSLMICCAPTSLLINKRLVELKPNPSLTVNPLCALMECVSCPTWDLEWAGNQLVITYCDGTRLKYLRR